MQFRRHVVNNGFGQIDHRREIDIGLIKLKRGEFWIVTRAQALVAKAAIDFEQLFGHPPITKRLRCNSGATRR